MFMNLPLGIAFALVAVSPLLGRWWAKVWLKANMPAQETVEGFPEIA
jgi:hypothetical protein